MSARMSSVSQAASALSVQVNFTVLDEAPAKMVVYLDPEEFHSTWLGNKAVYRTRMAIADGGELIVLAPGVKTFGEDRQIDALIRKYGYCGTPRVMQHVRESDDLPQNLSAAAHLIHGSSEGRFRITYCPGHLAREEIESVGYGYADLGDDARALRPRHAPRRLGDLARRRTVLLHRQPCAGALGASRATSVGPACRAGLRARHAPPWCQPPRRGERSTMRPRFRRVTEMALLALVCRCFSPV